MQVKTEGIGTATISMLAGVAGTFTGNFLLYSMLPAISGSLFSARMRWHSGKLKREDIGFAIFSALVFGILVGRWLGGLMPGSEDAVAVFCFFMSMIATSSMESLHDAKWNVGAWLTSIIDAATGKK